MLSLAAVVIVFWTLTKTAEYKYLIGEFNLIEKKVI